MWNTVLTTSSDRSLALARVALGAVMLPHGLQKALGWFGGGGLSGTIGFFEQALSVPAALTVLVILAELGGALGLLFGFLSRIAAAGVALVMAGAVALVHRPHGFFMNWSGTAGGEGFEYHILAVALALVVVVKGSGAYSLDRVLTRRPEAAAAAAPVTVRKLAA